MDIKKVMPRSRHPKKAKQEVIEISKKINSMAKKLRSVYPNKIGFFVNSGGVKTPLLLLNT